MSRSKISNTHCSRTAEADRLARFAEKISDVRTISLGVIARVRPKGNAPRVKLVVLPACIYCKIRGHNAVQELRIYGNNHELISEALSRFVDSERWKLEEHSK